MHTRPSLLVLNHITTIVSFLTDIAILFSLEDFKELYITKNYLYVIVSIILTIQVGLNGIICWLLITYLKNFYYIVQITELQIELFSQACLHSSKITFLCSLINIFIINNFFTQLILCINIMKFIHYYTIMTRYSDFYFTMLNINPKISYNVLSTYFKTGKDAYHSLKQKNNYLYHSVLSHADSVCCICLEEYKNNDKIVSLQCNHNYHIVCLTKWINEKNENNENKKNNKCLYCNKYFDTYQTQKKN
jgi:hypothetical protein